MEEVIKLERENHDEHDLLLGILCYFPEEAKWEESLIHDNLAKLASEYNILNKLKFENTEDGVYCSKLGKIFDLLDLSKLLEKLDNGNVKLNLELIKSYFDEGIKSTFSEEDLQALRNLSERLCNKLGIK